MGVYDMGGVGEGVGGGAGNFREISENFRKIFRKFPGKCVVIRKREINILG